MSLREMAKILNRNVSTISKEIKRNLYKKSIHYSVIKYSPTIAHRKYNERRINCHRPVKINLEVVNYLKDKINLHWSLDQIKNRYEKKLKIFLLFQPFIGGSI